MCAVIQTNWKVIKTDHAWIKTGLSVLNILIPHSTLFFFSD